jgi:hypothetical protein
MKRSVEETVALARVVARLYKVVADELGLSLGSCDVLHISTYLAANAHLTGDADDHRPENDSVDVPVDVPVVMCEKDPLDQNEDEAVAEKDLVEETNAVEVDEDSDSSDNCTEDSDDCTCGRCYTIPDDCTCGRCWERSST